MEYKIKTVLLGDFSTGKTCIHNTVCGRIVEDADEVKSTIGVGFSAQRFDFPEFKCNMHLWDTAGTERFRSLTKPYIRNSAIVFLVFDICDRTTFDHLDYWKGLAFEVPHDCSHSDHLPMICILACKAEKDVREHAVTSKEIEEKANGWSCPWWRVSTKGSIPFVGTPCQYIAQEHPVSGELKLVIPNRLNPAEKFRKISPREQMFTVFSAMANRFDQYIREYIKRWGSSQVCKETCSLGTFTKKGGLPLHLVDIPLDDSGHDIILTKSNNLNKCCK